MQAAQMPDDEIERLAALVALRILGTARTPEFDIFPHLASKLFSVPISAVSLIDKDRQWFIRNSANYGSQLRQLPGQLWPATLFACKASSCRA